MRLFSFTLVSIIIFLQSIAHANPTHEYSLDNGLKLIVREDHRAPVAMVQIWYKVGGSYEPNGITGISHLLEHMMFDGTQKYPAGEYSRILLQNGAQFNASTSADYTNYYIELSADKVPLALKLEADRMQHLNITPKEFKKEIKVVREERRLRVEDNPQAMTFERFSAAAFISIPYHHPVTGWMRDLQTMTLQNVKDWYEKWYTPNNAIIVIVGDVKPEKTLEQVKQFFGNIKTHPTPKLKSFTEQKPIGNKNVNVRLPAKLPLLIMGYNVPVIKTANKTWEPYALDVLTSILGEGDSSRLSKNLIRHQQIATDIGVAYSPVSLFSNVLTFIGIPTQGKTMDNLKTAMNKEINLIKNKPVDDAELKKIINQLIANKIYAKDSITYQALEIGSLEVIGLSWRLADEYINKIKAITPVQIQQVAKKYLQEKNLTVAKLKPTALNTTSVIQSEEKTHADA